MDRQKLAWTLAFVLLIATLPLWAGTEKDAKAEAWMKAATPGAAHAGLAEMAGKWRYVLTMWEEPGSAPMRVEGTSTKSMIMGGRFLKEEASSEYQKHVFEGVGITGFDNVTHEYVAVWFDNMNTGIFPSTGREEGKGQQAFRTTMHDPRTGKEVHTRSLLRTLDHDHHTFESYVTEANGTERLNMRVEYTRAD